MPSNEKPCKEVFHEAILGLIEESTRALEEVGPALIINLIREQMAALGLPDIFKNIDELLSLIKNAPGALLAFLEQDGDIALAFLKMLSATPVPTVFALLYVSGKNLQETLHEYKKTLDELYNALYKWELEIKKKGGAETAYKALARAQQHLKSARINLTNSLRAQSMVQGLQYIDMAKINIKSAADAICATPSDASTLPNLEVLIKLETYLTKARALFMRAREQYFTFVKYLDKYLELSLKISDNMQYQKTHHMGMAILHPVILSIRRLVDLYLKQKVLTCAQLRALYVSLGQITNLTTKIPSFYFNLDLQRDIQALARSIEYFKRQQTYWKFLIENFDKDAMNYKKHAIKKEAMTVGALANAIDGILSNNIFKAIDEIVARAQFFEFVHDALRQLNSENLFDSMLELIEKASSATNMFEAITQWYNEANKLAESLSAIKNPFFSVEKLNEIMNCIEKPDISKIEDGLEKVHDEIIEIASEITAKYMQLKNIFDEALLKIFEKFNISVPYITGLLRKLDNLNKKADALTQII